ncbi:NADH-quinone oxidoreductase subunit NuoN [Nevskia sp.]|uniref:NADH-quinone oxidoreductase subunit NuoN n=1 Tax=Nevskia sp. TaxID=1929292 RepID=UPI0025E4E947|nr:NADH-quinone oxidoreductase subunit NuoN [Nevskia sp.]
MTRNQLLALLPILFSSATVVWVMTAIAIKRHHWWNATFSVVGLNLALLGCVVAWFVSPQIVTPLLIVDSYACLYMAMVLATGLATATLSHAYMEGYEGNKEEVYLLLNLSVLGGLVLVCARHFASFFIGLELLSVPLYGLIGYLVKERRSLEASMKYLVLSAAASAFILFGMALIYSQTGALGFAEIGVAVAAITGGAPYTVMVMGGAMILVGIGFKLSLAPFHLWTPDVYEGAPAPVAAYLATASKVAVMAVLLRFFVEAKAYNYDLLLDVLSALAILSIVIGNLLALLQDNVKRLLAYSSIAHFGYLLVAFISAGQFATEAVGVYLLTYIVTTLAAFGVVTLVSSPYKGHDADVLWDYRGLFWRRPYLTAIMTTCMLSLAGIPMTAGFIGKFYAITAGVEKREWLLLAAVVFGSAVGLYYYLRAMVQMYLRAPWVRKYSAPLDWAQGTGGAMMVALMLLMIVLGIYPQPFISAIQAAGLQ